MTKFICTIVLLCSFILSMTSYGQILPNSSDVKKDKINTVVEMWYRYNVEGNLIPQGQKQVFELYNRSGDLKQQIKYIPGIGGIDHKIIFNYDKTGKESGITVSDGSGITRDQTKNSYNKKQQLVKTVGISPNNEYTTTYSYRDTLLISQIKKDKNNAVINSYHYEYNASNLRIQETFKGVKTYQTTYKYDDKNRKIEESFSVDSSISHRLLFTYNETGQIKTEEKIDPLERSLYILSYTI